MPKKEPKTESSSKKPKIDHFETEYLLNKCDCFVTDPVTGEKWAMIKLLFASKSGYFRTVVDSVWSKDSKQNQFVSPCELSSVAESWLKVRDYILFSKFQVTSKLFHHCWHLATVFQMDGFKNLLIEALECSQIHQMKLMNVPFLFSGDYCSVKFLTKLNDCFDNGSLVTHFSSQPIWYFLSLLKLSNLSVDKSIFISQVYDNNKNLRNIFQNCGKSDQFTNATLIFPHNFGFVFQKTWTSNCPDLTFSAYHYNSKNNTIDFTELNPNENISHFLCVGMKIVSKTAKPFDLTGVFGFTPIDLKLVPLYLTVDKIQ
jgi:hypothetical protein